MPKFDHGLRTAKCAFFPRSTSPLTPREREVVEAAQGLSNKERRATTISLGTVKDLRLCKVRGRQKEHDVGVIQPESQLALKVRAVVDRTLVEETSLPSFTKAVCSWLAISSLSERL